MSQRDTKINENVIARSASDAAILKGEIARYVRNDRLVIFTEESKNNHSLCVLSASVAK